MSTTPFPINLSIVIADEDHREAIEYIESAMRKAFGCDPPPTVGVICIAREGSEIVGSLVIQACTKHDQPFSIEDHYDFDLLKAPFPFDREKMLQAHRWTAVRPGVSGLLVRACGRLARDLGKEYLFIEAKPYSAERLRELGYDCKPIEGAVLAPERVRPLVGDDGMRFYEEDPLPTLYMLPI